MSEINMQKLFITYGYGYDQRNNYSVVECDDWSSGYNYAMTVTGGVFAFAYPEHEFLPQIERYGLTEIPLQRPTKDGQVVP